MKMSQRNPAFVGDDGQSTTSTLAMSVSGQKSYGRNLNDPKLIVCSPHTHAHIVAAGRDTDGGRTGSWQIGRETGRTGYLGQGRGVSNVLYRNVRGPGQCVAIPLHSAGQWRRRLSHTISHCAIPNWQTDLLSGNGNWAVFQSRFR